MQSTDKYELSYTWLPDVYSEWHAAVLTAAFSQLQHCVAPQTYMQVQLAGGVVASIT